MRFLKISQTKVMNTTDKQKQPNREHIEGSNDSKLPNVEPGKDKDAGTLKKNPNPRANENLNSPTEATGKKQPNSSNKTGTEITDGEDG